MGASPEFKICVYSVGLQCKNSVKGISFCDKLYEPQNCKYARIVGNLKEARRAQAELGISTPEVPEGGSQQKA